jgi:hypothetical protein
MEASQEVELVAQASIYYIIKTTNNQRCRLDKNKQIKNNGQD